MEIANHPDILKLQEIETIKTLKASYCRFVDTKQWAALSNLFWEDAHLVFKDVQGNILHEFTEKEQFLSLTAEMLKTTTTIHHVHNPEIELLSPDKAKAIWALEDQIVFPDDAVNAPFKVMHGYGHYHAILEKSDGKWKIKSFTLERLKLDFIQ